MHTKLLQVDKNSRKVMGEAIASYANTADTSKKDALVDFARGGFFVHGQGVEQFGPQGSPEAQANAEKALNGDKGYAGDNQVLGEKLTQAGGQSLTGYFEELLWNIVPDNVNISDIQQISIEKDIQTHYLTDKNGNKYVQVYMGVKEIRIHYADGSNNKYSLASDGNLMMDSEIEPTRYMAELSTTMKLETQDQDLKFEVEKLEIRLNHEKLIFNNKTCLTVVKNNNILDDKSHTKVTYKNQYLPTILTGVITGLIAATGVGILAIAAYAVLNGGPKKAFNKISSWIDNFMSRNENKSSLAEQFKADLIQKMPEVYTQHSDIVDKVDHLINLSEESQAGDRKSVSGLGKSSWNFMRQELKQGKPDQEGTIESESNSDKDLDLEEEELAKEGALAPDQQKSAVKEKPEKLSLDELDQHLPDPSEDAEDSEEPTKD